MMTKCYSTHPNMTIAGDRVGITWGFGNTITGTLNDIYAFRPSHGVLRRYDGEVLYEGPVTIDHFSLDDTPKGLRFVTHFFCEDGGEEITGTLEIDDVNNKEGE